MLHNVWSQHLHNTLTQNIYDCFSHIWSFFDRDISKYRIKNFRPWSTFCQTTTHLLNRTDAMNWFLAPPFRSGVPPAQHPIDHMICWLPNQNRHKKSIRRNFHSHIVAWNHFCIIASRHPRSPCLTVGPPIRCVYIYIYIYIRILRDFQDVPRFVFVLFVFW